MIKKFVVDKPAMNGGKPCVEQVPEKYVGYEYNNLIMAPTTVTSTTNADGSSVRATVSVMSNADGSKTTRTTTELTRADGTKKLTRSAKTERADTGHFTQNSQVADNG